MDFNRGHNNAVMRLFCLVPRFIHSYKIVDPVPVFNMYSDLRDSVKEVDGEFHGWKLLRSKPPFSTSERQLLTYCLSNLSMSTSTLSLTTLSLTTETTQRLLSSLKGLKPCLRSTMDQDRLSRLALFHIQQEYKLLMMKLLVDLLHPVDEMTSFKRPQTVILYNIRDSFLLT